MIYYAHRESHKYLDRLENVRSSTHEHNIVSVIGGLGFLRALGPNVKTLTLIDHRSDPIDYCKLILSLIGVSDSLIEFVSLVTNMYPENGDFESSNWIKVDYEKTNLYKLDDNILKAYHETIGILNPDIQAIQSTTRLYNKDIVVLPIGHSWRPYHFNWEFGKSVFASNESFMQLKDILSNIDITYMQSNFSEIDYSKITTPGIHTFILSSNCEERNYTRYDKPIFERVAKTMVSPYTFVSWNQYTTIRPMKHHEDAVAKIQPLTKDRNVTEIKTFAGYSFTPNELQCKNHVLVTDTDGKMKGDVFLYHISSNPRSNKDERKNLFENRMMKIKGAFHRIIILEWQSSLTTSEIIELLMKINYHYYYTMSVKWTGGNGFNRSSLITLDLRTHSL